MAQISARKSTVRTLKKTVIDPSVHLFPAMAFLPFYCGFPSDAVALICDLLENIVYQFGQLIFENHYETDQYHKIRMISTTPTPSSSCKNIFT